VYFLHFFPTILQDLKKAKELYDMRRPEYLAVADIVIDVTDKPLHKIAKEIIKKVKK
jgi:shikimate kinase